MKLNEFGAGFCKGHEFDKKQTFLQIFAPRGVKFANVDCHQSKLKFGNRPLDLEHRRMPGSKKLPK